MSEPGNDSVPAGTDSWLQATRDVHRETLQAAEAYTAAGEVDVAVLLERAAWAINTLIVSYMVRSL